MSNEQEERRGEKEGEKIGRTQESRVRYRRSEPVKRGTRMSGGKSKAREMAKTCEVHHGKISLEPPLSATVHVALGLLSGIVVRLERVEERTAFTPGTFIGSLKSLLLLISWTP